MYRFPHPHVGRYPTNESFSKTFIENLNFKIAAVENQTGKIKASEAELMAKVEKAV